MIFKFIKQAVIAILSFRGSLARVAKVSGRTKRIFLSNEQCIARKTLIDSNLEKPHCCPHIVSLYRRNGRSNTLDELSSRIHLPK